MHWTATSNWGDIIILWRAADLSVECFRTQLQTLHTSKNSSPALPSWIEGLFNLPHHILSGQWKDWLTFLNTTLIYGRTIQVSLLLRVSLSHLDITSSESLFSRSLSPLGIVLLWVSLLRISLPSGYQVSLSPLQSISFHSVALSLLSVLPLWLFPDLWVITYWINTELDKTFSDFFFKFILLLELIMCSTGTKCQLPFRNHLVEMFKLQTFDKFDIGQWIFKWFGSAVYRPEHVYWLFWTCHQQSVLP